MNTKTHPMLIAASIALILFCAIGTAAIMGWIPTSMSRNADIAAVDSAAAAKPSTQAANPAPAAPHRTAVAATGNADRERCRSCGVIDSVREIETAGHGSGLGAVGGAVVGGLLGNQVGGGRGKDAATVVGVVGGAVAGNQIERRSRSTTSYEILVRMNDGSTRTIAQSSAPAWRSGDHVRVVDGTIRSN